MKSIVIPAGPRQLQHPPHPVKAVSAGLRRSFDAMVAHEAAGMASVGGSSPMVWSGHERGLKHQRHGAWTCVKLVSILEWQSVVSQHDKHVQLAHQLWSFELLKPCLHTMVLVEVVGNPIRGGQSANGVQFWQQQQQQGIQLQCWIQQ